MNNKPCENILCVDDEENVLHMFRRTLGRQFHIHTASSAQQALKLLEEQHNFAVILSDYNMPDINGVEFLKSARQRSPNSVQIMLTGNIDLNIAVKAINETDIFRYLPKPCPSEVLSKVINDALDQYRLMREKVQLTEALEQKNLELQAINAELARQKYLLEYELDMAKSIYAKASIYGREDIAGLDYNITPKETVGGDFLLTHSINERGIHYVMFGDLTGHGLQSALAVLLVTEIFDALCVTEPEIEFLAQGINDKMCRKLPTGLFCAAILLKLDTKQQRIQLWQGGMPEAYLLDAQGNIVSVLKSDNLALGIISNPAFPLNISHHDLSAGDIASLFVFSDGVIEQTDSQSSIFDDDGVRRALVATPGKTRRVDYVLENLRSFQQSQPQNDDISLFELHFKPLLAAEDHS